MKRGNAVGKQDGTPARKKKSAKKPESKPTQTPVSSDQAIETMLGNQLKKKRDDK